MILYDNARTKNKYFQYSLSFFQRTTDLSLNIAYKIMHKIYFNLGNITCSGKY